MNQLEWQRYSASQERCPKCAFQFKVYGVGNRGSFGKIKPNFCPRCGHNLAWGMPRHD